MTRLAGLRRLALPLLAVVVSACSIVRPPASVEAPMPAAWHTRTATATSEAATLPRAASAADLLQWWRGLDDPLLAELIAAAFAVSPDLASASARIAEARFARVQARAAMIPSLDGALSASRSNTAAGTAAGGLAPAATIAQAGLQTAWEIDLFGGLGASRDAASTREEASVVEAQATYVSVAAETADSYFAERACARQLAVAGEENASRIESARLARLSANAGFTAPADAALAQASAADSSSRLTRQRSQCQLLRQGLVALTGLDPALLARRLDASPAQLSLPALRTIDSVPARVLGQRPDVYVAALAVAAASDDVGAAEAQRYPRLTLNGNVAVGQVRASGLQTTLDTWSIGPLTLTVPLFDGGVRKANAEAALARYDEAASQYRAKVRQAVREVEEALTRLQDVDARGADADAAVRGYEISLRASQARYDAGLGSRIELEESRRTLFAAQTSRVLLQRERSEAWVLLYRALGGGWQRDAAPLLAAPVALSATPARSGPDHQ